MIDSKLPSAADIMALETVVPYAVLSLTTVEWAAVFTACKSEIGAMEACEKTLSEDSHARELTNMWLVKLNSAHDRLQSAMRDATNGE